MKSIFSRACAVQIKFKTSKSNSAKYFLQAPRKKYFSPQNKLLTAKIREYFESIYQNRPTTQKWLSKIKDLTSIAENALEYLFLVAISEKIVWVDFCDPAVKLGPSWVGFSHIYLFKLNEKNQLAASGFFFCVEINVRSLRKIIIRIVGVCNHVFCDFKSDYWYENTSSTQCYLLSVIVLEKKSNI